MPSEPRYSRFELQIPSRVDGTLLECRIEHPQQDVRAFGAVFAHPYGPLGGSFDDRIVQLVKEELLYSGAVVATFNFRGVGTSKGKASWSGEPEAEDFESVVLLLSFYLRSICSAPAAGAGYKIIIGGYSFGSMVATRVRRQSLADSAADQDRLEHVASIYATAQLLANKLQSSEFKEAKSLSQTREQVDELKSEVITYSYLLVSPLPGLVSRLLTPTSRFGLFRGQWDDEQISRCPSLAVFGDNDCFSSAKKLRAWAQDLRAKPNSLFRSAEVKNAGHFWTESGSTKDLQEIMRTRLARLRDQKPRTTS